MPRFIKMCWAALIVLSSSEITKASSEEASTCSIQGTWTMVGIRPDIEGSVYSLPLTTGTLLKIYTKSHYIWSMYGEDGDVWAAGGGRYRLINCTKLEETAEYVTKYNNPSFFLGVGARLHISTGETTVGEKMFLELGIQGNTMTQKGVRTQYNRDNSMMKTYKEMPPFFMDQKFRRVE